jgi:hypothetical protein
LVIHKYFRAFRAFRGSFFDHEKHERHEIFLYLRKGKGGFLVFGASGFKFFEVAAVFRNRIQAIKKGRF